MKIPAIYRLSVKLQLTLSRNAYYRMRNGMVLVKKHGGKVLFMRGKECRSDNDLDNDMFLKE